MGLKLKSDFVLLDVKFGRAKLAARFAKRVEDPYFKIPVIIRGFIVGPWGHDDGISQEFQVQVSSVQEE